jgi:hypothetical protein
VERGWRDSEKMVCACVRVQALAAGASERVMTLEIEWHLWLQCVLYVGIECVLYVGIECVLYRYACRHSRARNDTRDRMVSL